MHSLKDFVTNNKYLLVAHRGSSGVAPENTLIAYQKAIEEGSDMIEMDVQVTSDNQLVTYHDYIPYGFNKGINNLTYEELQKIDVGIGYDTKYKNTQIPLLEHALELIQNKNYLMIEIKTIAINNFKNNSKILIDLIKKYNYIDKTLIGSFNLQALSNIKKDYPEIHTAAIKIPGDNRLPSEIKKIVKCDAYICSYEELSETIVKDAIENDLFIGVYSIDTKSQLIEVLNYNIKAIATNFPKKVREWFDEIK